MPTWQDYKWWVRSHRRQLIIRDSLAANLASHEEAVERLAVEANPPQELRALVLTPMIVTELREMIEVLDHKLEIRKRVNPEKEKAS